MKLATLSVLALLAALGSTPPAAATNCTGTTIGSDCAGVAWDLDTTTITLTSCVGYASGGNCLGYGSGFSFGGQYHNWCVGTSNYGTAPTCAFGVMWAGWLDSTVPEGGFQACAITAALDCSSASVTFYGQPLLTSETQVCEPVLGCFIIQT